MRITYALITFLAISLAVSAVAQAAANNGLVDTLAKQASISSEQAKTEVDRVFAALESELTAGREVSIRNFGSFSLSEREAHTGRNPKTGAALQIPAKRYPKFSPADSLKDRVNEKQAKQ